MFRRLMVASFLFLLIPASSDAAIVIQPDGAAGKDTFAYQRNHPDDDFGDRNYGGHGRLQVSNSSGSDAPKQGYWNRHSFLQFDLAPLSTIAAIGSAELRMFSDGVWMNRAGTTSSLFTVYQVTTAWGEHSLTWNNMPDFVDTPISSQTLSFTSTQSDPGWQKILDGRWVTWDVTDAVRAWIDAPATNHGFAFATDTPDGSHFSVEFLSSSYPADGATSRPMLVVTAVPEPSTAAVWGLLGICCLGMIRYRRRGV